MSEDEERAFESAVAAYLREELHAKRGLTAEQYRTLCRRAWDSCSTSPGFPLKILIDPLRPVETMLENSTQDYVSWRAAESLESTRGSSTDIRCSAVGTVKPDLSTEDEGEGAPADTEEPEVIETRRYILAVFDVLGFSALLASRGLDAVHALYEKLIAEAVTKDAMRTFNVIRLNRREMSSVWFALPVRHAHFSDTVLFWVPLVQHFIAPFMARCADMVGEALQLGLPLRGALAVGPAIMHAPSGTFVGSPLVEAARLEHAQDWLGVSLGPSLLAHDVSREFDPTLVLPYRIPLKRGSAEVSSGFALDWPSRFRARNKTNPAEAIRSLNTSPAHAAYYNNAVKFAEFSGGQIFRSEGLHPLGLGRLAAAAAAAGNAHTEFERQDERDLKDLAKAGPEGASVAAYLRAIASGGRRPDLPPALPRRVRAVLRDVVPAASGGAEFFALGDLVIAALNLRFGGAAFSHGSARRLAELESFSPRGKAVAEFIRALGSGESPDVPRKASADMRPFLKQALDWAVRGKVPSGILQRAGNDCLKTRFGYGDLDEATSGILNALGGMDRPWPAVGDYFRSVAEGVSDLRVPPDLPKTIGSNLARIGRSASLAGVQAPRMLEIVSVGLGDPFTGVDLLKVVNDLKALRRAGTTTLPAELDAAITRFTDGAKERVPVAERLRGLAIGAVSEADDSRLPVALRLFLTQLDAIAKDAPIPIDADLASLAAIRSRHAGGAMGDCILLSVRALLGGKEESRIFAKYLLTVAQGGPAAPAPILHEPKMQSAADEVRCLSDRAVGGIRMLMSRAKPGTVEEDHSEA